MSPNTTSEPVILTQSRAGAIWITLNRPAALNSITPEIVTGIDRALDLARDDPAVRAVVLTGTGRAFCAGRRPEVRARDRARRRGSGRRVPRQRCSR